MAPSPFFGNNLCLIPGTQLAFAVVSHCATALLKRLALGGLEATHAWSDLEVHDRIGYTADSPYLVPAGGLASFSARHGPRHSIVVHRDPVERLASVYDRFCVRREPNEYLAASGLVGATPQRFLDFVAYELGKPDPLCQDEHLRRQCDGYVTSEIDEVVAYGNLPHFLDAHDLGMSATEFAAALHGERAPDGHPFTTGVNRVRVGALYSADFAPSGPA